MIRIETGRSRQRLVGILLLSIFLGLSMQVQASPEFDYVFAITTDYDVSGSTATLDVFPPWSVEYGLAGVHSDAVARYHGGLIYVVNRLYADNIQVLDPEQGFSTVLQFSVGPGSNPRDIVFASDDRAYVTRYESTWLYEVDPSSGAVRDSIDLSPFADADGLPEMSQMAFHEDRLFVAVERLDRDYYWTPVAPGYLVVIDTETNQILDVDPGTAGVQAITLSGTNPSTELLTDQQNGIVLVGESGAWGAQDGGIERVDAGTLQALGFLSTEAQLGGDVTDFDFGPGGNRGYAVVSVTSPSWESYCVSFLASSGDLIGEVHRPGGFNVMDIEVHRGSGQLFVCDRTYTAPGVRVFDAGTDQELTVEPLFVGLPPSDLAVVGNEVTDVAEDPSREMGRAELAVWPNPLHTSAVVSFALPRALPVRLDVYDVAGRLVCCLADGRAQASSGRAVWDGRDDNGRKIASGVYFARLRAGAHSLERKLLVVR